MVSQMTAMKSAGADTLRLWLSHPNTCASYLSDVTPMQLTLCTCGLRAGERAGKLQRSDHVLIHNCIARTKALSHF